MAPKQYESWTIRLRVMTLLSILAGVVVFGMQLGDWRAWRSNTDTKILELQKWHEDAVLTPYDKPKKTALYGQRQNH